MSEQATGNALAAPDRKTILAARASGPGLTIMSNDEIDRVYRLAQALAMSRMFKDITQAEQAFAKILLGRDLGISPIRALMGLDVVRGSLQMRAVLLASFVRSHEDYDYSVVMHTDQECVIEFRRRFDGAWEVMGSSRYTIEEAKTAKLVKDDSAWKTAPRNMLFSRAMSNGVKWYMPDLLGGIPVYTEGDSFPDDPELVGGDSRDVVLTGEIVLPPAAERVLERAARLGHAGFADRGTAEMTLSGQPPEFVADWCARANTELDELESPKVAPVAPTVHGLDPIDDEDESPTDGNIDGLRDHADALIDQAALERELGNESAAEECEREAEELRVRADGLEGGVA